MQRFRRAIAASAVVAAAAVAFVPLGGPPAQAAPQCSTLNGVCASASGDAVFYYNATWNRWDALVHASCTHSSLAGNATGRCYVEGSQVDSCPIGTLGGGCATHGHKWFYGVNVGRCFTVSATTSGTLGTASDSHCRA